MTDSTPLASEISKETGVAEDDVAKVLTAVSARQLAHLSAELSRSTGVDEATVRKVLSTIGGPVAGSMPINIGDADNAALAKKIHDALSHVAL